jgi:hypothetical protein
MAASETDRVGPSPDEDWKVSSRRMPSYSARRAAPLASFIASSLAQKCMKIILGSSVSMWLRIAVNRDENRPAPRRKCRLEQ